MKAFLKKTFKQIIETTKKHIINSHCITGCFMSVVNLEEEGRVKAHLIKPYEPFNIENYIITALPADHDPNTSPVVYLIQKETPRFFMRMTPVFLHRMFGTGLKTAKLNYRLYQSTARQVCLKDGNGRI